MGKRKRALMVAAVLVTAATVLALRWQPERPIVTALHEAESQGRSLPAPDDKHRFFNGVDAMERVLVSASDADLEYLVSECAKGHQPVYDFLLLHQLTARGDHDKIVRLLTAFDWLAPGAGDFWDSDVEYGLATRYRGRRPLEGLDTLLDAAAAAPAGPIRQHLLERVRWAFGPTAVDHDTGDAMLAAARSWLAANRDRATIDHRYPAFADGTLTGFDLGDSPDPIFGTQRAVYVLVQTPREMGHGGPK